MKRNDLRVLYIPARTHSRANGVPDPFRYHIQYPPFLPPRIFAGIPREHGGHPITIDFIFVVPPTPFIPVAPANTIVFACYLILFSPTSTSTTHAVFPIHALPHSQILPWLFRHANGDDSVRWDILSVMGVLEGTVFAEGGEGTSNSLLRPRNRCALRRTRPNGLLPSGGHPSTNASWRAHESGSMVDDGRVCQRDMGGRGPRVRERAS